jgi:hypothetical protein
MNCCTLLVTTAKFAEIGGEQAKPTPAFRSQPGFTCRSKPTTLVDAKKAGEIGSVDDSRDK